MGLGGPRCQGAYGPGGPIGQGNLWAMVAYGLRGPISQGAYGPGGPKGQGAYGPDGLWARGAYGPRRVLESVIEATALQRFYDHLEIVLHLYCSILEFNYGVETC